MAVKIEIPVHSFINHHRMAGFTSGVLSSRAYTGFISHGFRGSCMLGFRAYGPHNMKILPGHGNSVLFLSSINSLFERRLNPRDMS
jgi:hypothetical protein